MCLTHQEVVIQDSPHHIHTPWNRSRKHCPLNIPMRFTSTSDLLRYLLPIFRLVPVLDVVDLAYSCTKLPNVHSLDTDKNCPTPTM